MNENEIRRLNHALIARALSGDFEPHRPGLCRIEPAVPPAPGGASVPTTGPPAVAPAAPPPAEPFAVFPDSEAFKKRIDRELRSALKDLGFADVEEAKRVREEHVAQGKAAEEAKRAQMTEIERLRADLGDRDRRLAEEMAAREQAQMNAHLNEVFAEKGIKNRDYARFQIVNKLASMNDDEVLDERAFLDALATDPQQAVALGLAAPPSTEQPRVPRLVGPTTSPGVHPGVPPAPPAGGGGPKVPTAFDKSPEEFRREMQRRGVPGY